jgi:Cu/Ag efflux protein CusF
MGEYSIVEQERRMRPVLLCAGFLAICLVAGCQPAPAKRYPIQGEVINVDAPRKMLVVKHGDVPGLMSAMTMGYEVADEKEIASLKPGDKISAELVVSDNVGKLEHIVVQPKTGASGDSAVPSKTN